MGKVRWATRAQADLRTYRRWLEKEAGKAQSDVWIDALLDWVDELGEYPALGTLRPELGPDLRTRAFRRNVVVLHAVQDGRPTILRLFGRGRNVTSETIRRL